MQITYVGPSPAVTIAETDQLATRGEPIDVADDLAARLLEQDVWSKATATKEKK